MLPKKDSTWPSPVAPVPMFRLPPVMVPPVLIRRPRPKFPTVRLRVDGNEIAPEMLGERSPNAPATFPKMMSPAVTVTFEPVPVTSRLPFCVLPSMRARKVATGAFRVQVAPLMSLSRTPVKISGGAASTTS